MLKKTHYRVRAEGSIVKVDFDNVPISMDYNTALQLAQYLRISGREAKANAGDKSIAPRVCGVLTDAEQNIRKQQSMSSPLAAYR